MLVVRESIEASVVVVVLLRMLVWLHQGVDRAVDTVDEGLSYQI